MSRTFKDICCTIQDNDNNFNSDGYVATTYEGHLLVVDYNQFTHNAFVKYPVYKNSVAVLSQVFAWLDSNEWIDSLILDQEKFTEEFSDGGMLKTDGE